MKREIISLYVLGRLAIPLLERKFFMSSEAKKLSILFFSAPLIAFLTSSIFAFNSLMEDKELGSISNSLNFNLLKASAAVSTPSTTLLNSFSNPLISAVEEKAFVECRRKASI